MDNDASDDCDELATGMLTGGSRVSRRARRSAKRLLEGPEQYAQIQRLRETALNVKLVG